MENTKYKRLSSKTQLTSWLFICLIAVGSNGAAVVLEEVKKLENISQQFKNYIKYVGSVGLLWFKQTLYVFFSEAFN